MTTRAIVRRRAIAGPSRSEDAGGTSRRRARASLLVLVLLLILGEGVEDDAPAAVDLGELDRLLLDPVLLVLHLRRRDVDALGLVAVDLQALQLVRALLLLAAEAEL